MPNTINLHLLENKQIKVDMHGIPLGNEDSYRIVAGEENSTIFAITSIPPQYNDYDFYVLCINSKGYKCPLSTDEGEEISGEDGNRLLSNSFTLPLGMAVEGYGYIIIYAKQNEEKNVWQTFPLKIWKTFNYWKDYVDYGEEIVKYSPQTLTDEQKQQARDNIASVGYITLSVYDTLVSFFNTYGSKEYLINFSDFSPNRYWFCSINRITATTLGFEIESAFGSGRWQEQGVALSVTFADVVFSVTTYYKPYALEGDLQGKQDILSQVQLNAVNSGVDSVKVAQIQSNTEAIEELEADKELQNALIINDYIADDFTINRLNDNLDIMIDGIIYKCATVNGNGWYYASVLEDEISFVFISLTNYEFSEHTIGLYDFVATSRTIAGISLVSNISAQNLTDALVLTNTTTDVDYIMGET